MYVQGVYECKCMCVCLCVCELVLMHEYAGVNVVGVSEVNLGCCSLGSNYFVS